ncbi:MAG: class I SAM-dependent methyltransferase [Planctomycetota bacterium]|nr:class I SAM-dependent methyltransferase [Planctomycetota bacterium]
MAEKPGGSYINDLPDSAAGRGYYALDTTRDEYLAFHYPAGDPLERLLGDRTPPLSERFPFAVKTLWAPRPDGVALDVGAAVGRVTFDLARDHRLAVGFDFSPVLVAGAQSVARTGHAAYSTTVEGELSETFEVAVDPAPNARFLVADALTIPFSDATFETVTALNLLDRVPDPSRLLAELTRVTAPGGTLILSSPFTWLRSFTPRERWLGGFRRDGKPVRGFEGTRALLDHAFALDHEVRLPFFIPHHTRSGQLGVAHVQRFVRR